MKNAFLMISTILFSGALCAQEEIYSESGEFSADGDASSNRHVIPVDAGKTIEVVVIGESVDTTLTATLPNGDTIRNDDYQDLNAGFSRTLAEGGELEVVAAPLSSGMTGSYRVVARTLPPPGRIQVGQTVEDRLNGDSGSGDMYELTGSAGTRVAIDLKSYDFDAYLTLVDSEGNEISDDDGGDEGFNSRLSYRFEEDETVNVTASSISSQGGGYQLTVSELSGEAAAHHTGRLTDNSPHGYDGTRHERHEVEGEAGETLTVELKSDAFDPVVYVSNPDGSNLVTDDDGGNDNNSVAIATLPETGTYVVYVTAYGNSTGSYELTIYR